MTDYDVDIREIDPEYKHTLPRQAGREVDDGRELHLSRLTVTVRLSWGSGSDYDGQTFDVVFDVDHEGEEVRTKTVGDAHGKRQSFRLRRLLTAIDYAERAAVAFVEDVGPDYHLVESDDQLLAIRELAAGDDARVHTELEVAADD